MTYELTLQKIQPVTHDTHHLVFDRPGGYEFTPGQATDLTLAKEGWKDEARPFTFVNLPGSNTLEFVIKSYPDHDGVTEQIGMMTAGDKVTVTDPWGAIHDEGPGYFIAGGAGVTPFIAVLRKRLAQRGNLDDCTLIFSNRTEADIILRDEFEAMKGLRTVFTVTDEKEAGVQSAQIDKTFLSRNIVPESGHYYICGPEPMIDDITAALKELGVSENRIVVEGLD